MPVAVTSLCSSVSVSVIVTRPGTKAYRAAAFSSYAPSCPGSSTMCTSFTSKMISSKVLAAIVVAFNGDFCFDITRDYAGTHSLSHSCLFLCNIFHTLQLLCDYFKGPQLLVCIAIQGRPCFPSSWSAKDNHILPVWLLNFFCLHHELLIWG